MIQEIRKTILIICEGRRSEPDYFNNLRNEVIEKKKGVSIKILPIPRDEPKKVEDDLNDFKIRKGGKRRQIKALNNKEDEPDLYIVENEYKAQPTCYVRKAQLAHLEGGYDELWVVYDKDGHPQHEEAFKLSKNKAICDKIVNIGFSSISFEVWILMHFELCNIPFLKSQCKDNNKKELNCGTLIHEDDCNGEKCVVGRIVKKGYLASNSSKSFNYIDYAERLNTALKNALLIRSVISDGDLFYNKNPYVTIDRLVFKLKHVEKGDLIWEYRNCFEVCPKIFVIISNYNNEFKIEIVNKSNQLFIIEKGLVRLIDLEFNIRFCCDRILLDPMQSLVIYKTIELNIDDFHYALFKISDYEFKILDIIQMKRDNRLFIQ